MSIIETSYMHITFNKKTQPIIEGANFKVIELMLDKIDDGGSLEEL